MEKDKRGLLTFLSYPFLLIHFILVIGIRNVLRSLDKKSFNENFDSLTY